MNLRGKLRDELKEPFRWEDKIESGSRILYVEGETAIEDDERVSHDGYVQKISDTPLRIKTIKDLIGDRPLFEFIDVSHTELPYDSASEDDFPRINVFLQGEVNNKLTVDSRLKERQFPMSVSLYLNHFIKDGRPARARKFDAVELLSGLEVAALEIDYNMHQQVINKFEEVTLFDLSSVNYDIGAQTGGIVGVAQMQYQVHYVLNYDQVTSS